MVNVAYTPAFEKTIRKLKDNRTKARLKQQIVKIVENPDIGKPMRYARKDTREVYIPLFRLSYFYDKEKDTFVFLALSHKDAQ